MALLWLDGFDYYGNGSALIAPGRWGGIGVTNESSVSTLRARTGTASLFCTNNTTGYGVITKALPAVGGFVVGFAFNCDGPTNQDWFKIREGSTDHLVIGGNGSGAIVVKRGTTLLATGLTILPNSAWVYIEFKGIIHDTLGSYEVRIDGVSQPELTNVGPTDTRNGGTTGQWDRVALWSAISGGLDQFIDDLYILDMSGPAPRNDFLGPIKIECLMPQTDAVAVGSNQGLTPSTGTDHGALVDEIPPNGTDYNSSPTVGIKDTYQYPSMTLSGTVLGVEVLLYVQKSDAVARQVCAVARTGGVDNDGANISPSTSFQYLTPASIFPQNPNGGAPIEWTVAAINSGEFGMKVTL